MPERGARLTGGGCASILTQKKRLSLEVSIVQDHSRADRQEPVAFGAAPKREELPATRGIFCVVTSL